MTSPAYTLDDLAEVRRLRQVRRRVEYSDRPAYDAATAEEAAIHGAVYRRWEDFKRTGQRTPRGRDPVDAAMARVAGERVEGIDPEARRSDPWAPPPDDSKATAADRDLAPAGPPAEHSLKSLAKTPPKRTPRPAPKL